MNELSLFTGAGGGLLGTKLLGFNHIGYVEINEYCQKIIAQRIKDGILDEAPIFGDIRTFTSEGYAESYQGMVDVITAGFPCQPFSVAGKRKGNDDERDMWPATRDTIRIIRPRYGYLENVTNILVFGYYGRILSDLAAMGYVCRWGCVSAGQLGATHLRNRWWCVAYNTECGDVQRGEIVAQGGCGQSRKKQLSGFLQSGAWPVLSEFRTYGTDHGVANRVDRLKALGNGQVPAVAATAWRLLNKF